VFSPPLFYVFKNLICCAMHCYSEKEFSKGHCMYYFMNTVFLFLRTRLNIFPTAIRKTTDRGKWGHWGQWLQIKKRRTPFQASLQTDMHASLGEILQAPRSVLGAKHVIAPRCTQHCREASIVAMDQARNHMLSGTHDLDNETMVGETGCTPRSFSDPDKGGLASSASLCFQELDWSGLDTPGPGCAVYSQGSSRDIPWDGMGEVESSEDGFPVAYTHSTRAQCGDVFGILHRTNPLICGVMMQKKWRNDWNS